MIETMTTDAHIKSVSVSTRVNETKPMSLQIASYEVAKRAFKVSTPKPARVGAAHWTADFWKYTYMRGNLAFPRNVREANWGDIPCKFPTFPATLCDQFVDSHKATTEYESAALTLLAIRDCLLRHLCYHGT